MAQRIARGLRNSASVILQFIRENTRDAVDINCLADLLDIGWLVHSSCRMGFRCGAGDEGARHELDHAIEAL
ncbi:hypothetical protein AB0H17_24750 [Streptomyces olivoreticuli]